MLTPVTVVGVAANIPTVGMIMLVIIIISGKSFLGISTTIEHFMYT